MAGNALTTHEHNPNTRTPIDGPPTRDEPAHPDARDASGRQRPHRTEGVASGRKRSGLRPILARLHFYAGIIAAPLIIVASLTGLGYALAPTLENTLDRDLLTVAAPAAGATPDLSVSQQVSIAQEAAGGKTLASVWLPKDDTHSTRVLFADENLPPSTKEAVFINPHTGEVLGVTTSYGGSGALPLRHWLSIGHKNLWLGEPGRIYSEAAAAWMGFLAISGAAMWWGVQRGNKRVRAMFRVSTAASSRTTIMRTHSALGMWALAGMLFLTITGLTWSSFAGDNIATIRKELGWATPRPAAELPAGTPPSYGALSSAVQPYATDIDAVADAAKTELTLPITLNVPQDDASTWIAQETRAPWRASYDAITVSGADGQVTSRLDFADFPFMAKLTYWLIQAHMGLLFGLPNQLLLVALAIGIIAVALKGYQMWWKRARKTAPEVKDWRVLTAPAGLLLVAGLVAYGVFAPLFGLSLLGLVACDLCWVYAKKKCR